MRAGLPAPRDYFALHHVLQPMRLLLFFAAAVAMASPSLPVAFEPNRGQASPEIRYLSHTPNGTLLLAPTRAILKLQGASPISIVPQAANPSATIAAA